MVTEERTLTVCSRWGLCNRLRALLSGLAIAEATGRAFTMLWPRTVHVSASFPELFANDFHVREGDLPQGTPIYGLYVGGPSWPDFLQSQEQHLSVLSGTWLLRPEKYPAHQTLWPRCEQLMNELQPSDYVRQAMDSFRAAHFRPTMIGVHLRRGDFNEWEVRNNTRAAMQHVDAFLAQSPDAGILLCTDDGAPHPRTGKPTPTEGVKKIFRKVYGERVVWPEPRSLDRRLPEAAQDAVVDLMLLRQTDYFIGTKNSSFSQMARFGRSIPSVLCGGQSLGWRLQRTALTVTGVYPLFSLLAYLQFRKKDVPPSQLLRYYRARLQRLFRR